MSGAARGERREREERRAANDMSWAKRLIEYLLVILVAIIVAVLIIWWVLRPGSDCTDCGGGPSVPQLRAECDRQFGGTGVPIETLQANEEGEYLLAFREPAPPSDQSSEFSSATASRTVTTRPPGFVMVRVQPQFGYDYLGGQDSSSTADTSNVRPDTAWDEVTVTVARYVNPVRNERVCSEDRMRLRYRDGKFESYCDIPLRFTADDWGQATYRLFVSNRSSVPIDYCILTNCDYSAPWVSGSTCQIEQSTVQALQ